MTRCRALTPLHSNGLLQPERIGTLLCSNAATLCTNARLCCIDNRKTRAGYMIRHSRVTAHSLAGMRFAGFEALGLLCSQPLLEPHWHCLSA